MLKEFLNIGFVLLSAIRCVMGDLIDLENARQKAEFQLMAKFASKFPANDQVDLLQLYNEFLSDPRPPKWFLIIPVLTILCSIAGLVGMFAFLGWLSEVTYK